MNIVEVQDLTRVFGDFSAVDSISFNVGQGEIFGFLGPNGAGKTTTINMLCTLLKPTSGSARVNGFDIERAQASVRQSIGLIFQESSLDEQLTGSENLRFHSRMYGVNSKTFERRSRELVEMVDLAEKIDDLVEIYSGGMKRRLEIARGLLHHPQVLFLDEPTIGLDPQTRRHIWGYLNSLRDSKSVTMFMTTHYMDEAENCDRIAIIDHGEIVALDTPDNLKGLVGGDIITLHTSDNQLASRQLESMGGVTSRFGPQDQLILETERGDQMVPRLVETLSNGTQPVRIESVNLRRPTLEDVFIKLTGHAIREGEADVQKDRTRRRRRMWGRR